jgi:hypothetical protein
MTTPNSLQTNPVRVLSTGKIRACPHFIFDPSHYPATGPCRCYDSSHTEMEEWGYKWNGRMWIIPEASSQE